MDQIDARRPAHGASPELRAAFARQQNRNKAESFFGALGAEEMCAAFAREVTVRVVQDDSIAGLLAEGPDSWEAVLREHLVAYWGVAGVPARTISYRSGAGELVTSAWLGHARAVAATVDLPGPLREVLGNYFLLAARRALPASPS